MSTPIPSSLRAAAGLAAVAIDSARRVPRQLVGLPVLAVSTALQASLKAQQAYAGLVSRGDDVLGQLRGTQESPPWARFDEDEPARPRSAFDAVAEEDAAADAALAAELAIEVELDVDRALDPDLEPDVLTLAEAAELEPEFAGAPDLDEAHAGGLDVGEIELDPEPAAVDAADLAIAAELAGLPGADVTDPAGADTGHLADVVPIADARPDGSGTEPGADLPAAGAALTADAAATGAALAADAAVGGGGGDLDGHLAVDPPVPGYDELSIPQLRGRLRALSLAQVQGLLAYERANRSRPPYLTMLENRVTTLRSR